MSTLMHTQTMNRAVYSDANHPLLHKQLGGDLHAHAHAHTDYELRSVLRRQPPTFAQITERRSPCPRS